MEPKPQNHTIKIIENNYKIEFVKTILKTYDLTLPD